MNFLSAIQGVAGFLGGMQQSAEGNKLLAQGRAQRQQLLDNSKYLNDLTQKALASTTRDASTDYGNFSQQAATALVPTSYGLIQAQRLGVSPQALAAQTNPQFQSQAAKLRDEAYRQAMNNAYSNRALANFQSSQTSNQNYADVLSGFGTSDMNDGSNMKNAGYQQVGSVIAGPYFNEENLRFLDSAKIPDINALVGAGWNINGKYGPEPPDGDWSNVDYRTLKYFGRNRDGWFVGPSRYEKDMAKENRGGY